MQFGNSHPSQSSCKVTSDKIAHKFKAGMLIECNLATTVASGRHSVFTVWPTQRHRVVHRRLYRHSYPNKLHKQHNIFGPAPTQYFELVNQTNLLSCKPACVGLPQSWSLYTVTVRNSALWLYLMEVSLQHLQADAMHNTHIMSHFVAQSVHYIRSH